MNKKKVIISNYDSPHNPYFSGGGATAISEVSRRLSSEYSIEVLTSKYPGYSDHKDQQVKYTHIGMASSYPKISQVIFQLMLPFYAVTKQYDLWVETFTPPFTATFLPLFTQKPIISLVHMLPALDLQRKYHFPLLPRLFEILVLKVYKNYIIVSDSIRNDILHYQPKAKITLIPNGVNFPSKYPLSKPKHILFLGRIEIDQKGIDLLLSAYQKLQSDNPPLLVIAGSGPKSRIKALQNLIAKLNLQKQVTLTGFVSGKLRDNLFRQAHFVVVPSRFETFCLVALEALSYTKALVCFDIPGLKWIPSRIAIKAKTISADSLYQQMHKYLTSPSFCASVSSRGVKFATGFTWDAASKKYAKAFRSYINQ